MSESPKPIVGVDIGGTKIAVAVIDSANGTIYSRASMPTDAQRGYPDGLARIRALIESAVAEAGLTMTGVAGIGIGSAGPLDSARGRIQNEYTLPTWVDVPIVDDLVQAFSLPTVLVNDGHAAALAELWLGAGRGAQHMIYVTVSTGIGGALVVNGRLHRGVGLMAGEVGHQIIDPHGPLCYCGAHGCLEMLASGPAIATFARQRAAPDGLLLRLVDGDAARITAETVTIAARQGDPVAQQVLDETALYLGMGLSNLMNIFGPEVIVLGGGVMKSWDLLGDKIIAAAKGRIGMVPFELIRIVPAELGTEAGVVGAAKALLDFGA
jgi:glucokinase